MKLIQLVTFVAVTIPFPSVSYGKLCLQLSAESDTLDVSVTNNGNVPVLFNKRMLIEPIKGELTLVFENNRQQYRLTAMVRLAPADREDYVTLAPGEFIGTRFDISYLRDMYSLDMGCYSVKARYKDRWATQPHSYKDELSSMPIELCIRSAKR